MGKNVDDASAFPSWSNVMPTTLTDFYAVMSYNQHTITTKVATKNGGFFVSDPGHTVQYYKDQFQQSGQGYLGPYGIFVEEMLQKVEAEYGAAYFDDVDIIMMMITDGSDDWYVTGKNYSGVGYLGVQYTTGNGKTFGYYDGVNSEFAEGEKVCEWLVCHEYGHFLGLLDLEQGTKIGTYSLMQNTKVNDPNEGVTPLSVKDITDLGWLDMNDPTRVQTVTANTSVTLQPLRSPTGIVAAKVLPDPNHPFVYFLIANHQRSTNVYDGTYPADGLLIWHITGNFGTDALDIECAVGLDPITYGFNKDHLDLYNSNPANYHGEGLASDFFNASGQSQFTPWTNPNTDYDGNNPPPTYLAVTNITSNGNSMSFDVIYNFSSGIITVDSWWKNTPFINGNVTVNAGKTVTVIPGATAFLPDNYTFTLNPGATLYVDGTLRIETNTTITGGGCIIKRGGGEIKQTWSASALASNNSRKLARDSNGNYHLVFETIGEICYEKLINGGTAIGEFRRLSGGNGGHHYPSIAARDNKIYVVWQRFDGTNYDLKFRKSTDGGTTWSAVTEPASNFTQSQMFPVIISPATDKLTLIFRGNNTLRYHISDNDGSAWSSGSVPNTGSNHNSPTLAPTKTYSGSARSALVYANSSGPINYRYYMNGPDSTGWSAAAKNLSAIVPGTYTNHQSPSIAPSGTTSDKHLHVAWKATLNNGSTHVIIHRMATDWGTWPSVYSTLTYYGELVVPSITGLSNSTAEVLF